QISGYFKNPEATAKLKDSEGFVKMGDIVEQRAADSFVWIDRKNNVLKLSQGEFVAIGRLESLFSAESEIIKQIYIHVEGTRSYLVAVVVPDAEATASSAQELKDLLRQEIRRISKSHNLQPYEVPKDFLIENEPFALENGLLTGLLKQSKPNLKA